MTDFKYVQELKARIKKMKIMIADKKKPVIDKERLLDLGLRKIEEMNVNEMDLSDDMMRDHLLGSDGERNHELVVDFEKEEEE